VYIRDATPIRDLLQWGCARRAFSMSCAERAAANGTRWTVEDR